jgi:hypothetical protein
MAWVPPERRYGPRRLPLLEATELPSGCELRSPATDQTDDQHQQADCHEDMYRGEGDFDGQPQNEPRDNEQNAEPSQNSHGICPIGATDLTVARRMPNGSLREHLHTASYCQIPSQTVVSGQMQA